MLQQTCKQLICLNCLGAAEFISKTDGYAGFKTRIQDIHCSEIVEANHNVHNKEIPIKWHILFIPKALHKLRVKCNKIEMNKLTLSKPDIEDQQYWNFVYLMDCIVNPIT